MADLVAGFERTESGLFYRLDSVGTGPKPNKGQQVQVHYTGMLPDGTVFDSSVQRGTPIGIAIGVGQVIEGWEKGLKGAKVGEKRVLQLGPQFAYGSQGAGKIPANVDLDVVRERPDDIRTWGKLASIYKDLGEIKKIKTIKLLRAAIHQ